jgi:hypothetical protein
LALQSAGTTAIYVDTSQNVGINATPTAQFQVFCQDSASGKAIRAAYNSTYYTDYTETGLNCYNNDYWIKTKTAGTNLIFYTNNIERMRISSAGYVTTPYQPAFYAYMNSGGSTLFASNANFVFDTVSVNTGSNYSTSTGRFTAPVAGWYHFSTTVLGQAISGGTSWEIGLTNQTGGLGALGGRMTYQSNYTGSGGYIWACASCTMYLNVGDYMKVTNNSGVSAYINSGPWACFSGHLIG